MPPSSDPSQKLPEAELEPIANEMPAPLKHAFLSAVLDARMSRQFQLGPPRRMMDERWAAPLRPFLVKLGALNEAIISQIEAACADAPLKIHSLLGLIEVEEADLRSALNEAKLPPIVQRALMNGIREEQQEREEQERAEEERQRLLEQAFPLLLQLELCQPLKEVLRNSPKEPYVYTYIRSDICMVAHALSVHGVEAEIDLKYVEDRVLDELFTTQGEPLQQGDKAQIRELRQRLVEEAEASIRSEREEGQRREEEVRVTQEEAELLRRAAEEAAQKKEDGDLARHSCRGAASP